MMKIHIDYGTQMRDISSTARESIDVEVATTLLQLLQRVAMNKEPAFAEAMFGKDLQLKPGVLVFVNDDSIQKPEHCHLNEEDRVSILTLVSGG